MSDAWKRTHSCRGPGEPYNFARWCMPSPGEKPVLFEKVGLEVMPYEMPSALILYLDYRYGALDTGDQLGHFVGGPRVDEL